MTDTPLYRKADGGSATLGAVPEELFPTPPDVPREDAPPTRFALVALERGIDAAQGGLTYAVPPEVVGLCVGERVAVPLGRGNKPARGYVLGLLDTVSDELRPHIKPILGRAASLDMGLSPQLVQLAKWIAGYYCCPLGMVFASMTPAAVKHGTGTTHRTQVRAGGEPVLGEPDAKLPKLQAAILARARSNDQWWDIKALAHAAGAKSDAAVRQLMDKGLLEHRRVETVVSDLDLRAQEVTAGEVRGGPPLTEAQARAVATLTASLDRGFSVHLLHGVTGSGKTEVYLRTIEALRAMADGGWRMADGKIPTGDGPSQTSASLVAVSEPRLAREPSAIHPPGVIVLVPEIALTPQTVGRFLARFGHLTGEGDGVAVLHSGLTAAQRHAQWRRIRRGEANIVVGARSAIFAPLPRVGLVIVDEEHEGSYKQDQLPRYHARDVAIKRAQLAGCPVLLGSATPSLESAFNAGVGGGRISDFGFRISEERGDEDRGEAAGSDASANPKSEIKNPKYNLISLPDRVPGAHLPRVELVDLVTERKERKGIHLLSRRLEQMMHHTLAPTSSGGGGQVILLLNRRGYANYIACPDHRCGWMMRCDHCDVTMVYHRGGKGPRGRGAERASEESMAKDDSHLAPRPLGPSTPSTTRCHHCNAEQALATVCPESGHKVSVFGLGTQRVEAELERKFPGVPMSRMDADAMRTAKDYQQTLDKFASGDTKILLGTQMIAKGLDVPNVRLVGVVSGDTSLNFPDFRASERTFQLIAQVAGRAGRGEHMGRVVVQSFNVEDPAIRLAAAHDFTGFATREIATRAEAGLPPIGRMARIVLRDTDFNANVKRAVMLGRALSQANEQLNLGIRLRGPSPCPIARLADHHRQQIELLSQPPAAASAIQKLLTHLRNRKLLVSDQHTAIDVDPVSLL